MTLNRTGNQAKLAARVLAGAFSGWLALAVVMLLTAGCGSVGPTPKPDADMTNPQEEAQRNRGRTREEMAELVDDIERLHKKTEEVWSEYVALKGEQAAEKARYGDLRYSDLRPRMKTLVVDGLRQNLESLQDNKLPALGSSVAHHYRQAVNNHKRAEEVLEAAKTNQQ